MIDDPGWLQQLDCSESDEMCTSVLCIFRVESNDLMEQDFRGGYEDRITEL